jgi:hypothetical protein
MQGQTRQQCNLKTNIFYFKNKLHLYRKILTNSNNTLKNKIETKQLKKIILKKYMQKS